MTKMPVNMNAHVYYNVVKPDGMGDWQTRFQIAFMFPAKSMKEKMKAQNQVLERIIMMINSPWTTGSDQMPLIW